MYLFTSESVSPGHPDKVADIIADSVVDYILSKDPNGRVACEVLVAGKHITLGGEITSKVKMTNATYKKIVDKALQKIGYDGNENFTKAQTLYPEDVKLHVYVNKQSPDIAKGVDQEDGEIGAGDQGIMFGFASSEVKDTLMPTAINLSRKLCNNLYTFAKKHREYGVDIKTQVTIDYGTKKGFDNGVPKRIDTIVASIPSKEGIHIDEVRRTIKKEIDKTFKGNLLYDKDNCKIYINPTGKYTNHGPLHDSGLTGRKLIVDTFGGYSSIGGGAQSSKDFSKVDRSGLYAARYIAKNIVAAGLAKKCSVQLSYAIGVAKPVSVNVDTMKTGIISDTILSNFVLNNFKLTPNWIKDAFKLDKPLRKDTFSYASVAANGQVGDNSYPWEKLDCVALFKGLKNGKSRK